MAKRLLYIKKKLKELQFGADFYTELGGEVHMKMHKIGKEHPLFEQNIQTYFYVDRDNTMHAERDVYEKEVVETGYTDSEIDHMVSERYIKVLSDYKKVDFGVAYKKAREDILILLSLQYQDRNTRNEINRIQKENNKAYHKFKM